MLHTHTNAWSGHFSYFLKGFSYFLKGPFNQAGLLRCAWNSFAIVPLPPPPSQSSFIFFPNCVCVFVLELDGSSGGWNDGCRIFQRISAN